MPDEYHQMTIRDIILQIENGELYLPAIQRHFVWKPDKIENLFDSIMLGYPIGTFLFWKVTAQLINDKKYSIYRFIQNYNERDNSLNEKVGRPIIITEITAVLDGQQRIGSMYMALKGSVAFKKPKARRDNRDAYPEKQLYLNILKSNKSDDEEDTCFEFNFLSNEEYEQACEDEKDISLENRPHLWFLVKNVLGWNQPDDATTFAIEKGWIQNKIIVGNLIRLWHRICKESIINYFEVKNDNLDNVLDIFVRVNSGGVILSKTDLLFSTIVSQWDDARDEFEKLLVDINQIGEHFNFNNDFLMRACLVLTDSPVLFKVETFKEENIDKIKNGWGAIKTSLIKVVTLISGFGFNGENLLSQNAIIPIAYYIFKDGVLDDNSKTEIKKYLITSLLKKVFSTKGDAVLRTIRSNMRNENKIDSGIITYELKSNKFLYSQFTSMKLPGDHRFSLSDEDIEELFQNKKGPYTFMVLSLLYPQYKWNTTVIHQDHIHPISSFKKEHLKEIGIKNDDISNWINVGDQLANLELLVGSENESKNDSTFKEWFKRQPDPVEYRKRNYIPDVSYEFSDFLNFVKERKEIMKKEIEKRLV